MKWFSIFFVVALVFTVANRLEAGQLFDGKNLRVEQLYPSITDVMNSTDVVVGSGVEIAGFPGLYDGNAQQIDIADKSIVLTCLHSGAFTPTIGFNGFGFLDYTGTIGPITGVIVNPTTDLTGFDASRITFDSDNIYLNYQGLACSTGKMVVLNVATVPEPSAIVLLASGVASLLFMAWRRRRRAG